MHPRPQAVVPGRGVALQRGAGAGLQVAHHPLPRGVAHWVAVVLHHCCLHCCSGLGVDLDLEAAAVAVSAPCKAVAAANTHHHVTCKESGGIT